MVPEPQNRFTRRQSAERGSVRLVFFLFLSVVAVIGWLYVFFISEAFRVRAIEVVSGKGIDPLQIKREVYEVIDTRPHPFWLPVRHSLFLKVEELELILTERLAAERVTIDKLSTNILRLTVQERVRRFILHTPHQYFWIDKAGVVLGELSNQEKKDVDIRLAAKRPLTPTDPPIIFYDPDVVPLVIDQGIPDPQISSWLAISLQMQKQGVNYREIEPSQDTSSTKLVVKTAQGYEAWFDASLDTLEMQIEAFKAFQEQKPKDLQVKEYVDVRIPNRVYVR